MTAGTVAERHVQAATTVACAECSAPLPASAISGGFDRHAGCETTPVTTEWRWGCIDCDLTGAADNPDHAAALLTMHRRFNCPATATTYDSGVSLPLTARPPRDDFLARVARRNRLHKLYPDQVPAYTRPWRASTNRNTR